MAIKKSDLYASLWASCDELRGGMDASQYKDYVLFMLFIKYISDKYGNSDAFAPPVVIPKGASFRDMIALKGKPDIGDKINTQIIQPLIEVNDRLARSDFPDFNDPNKLGEGQAMVDRLTNLVGIFQKPELDFSQNRAEHDDILGDAYYYYGWGYYYSYPCGSYVTGPYVYQNSYNNSYGDPGSAFSLGSDVTTSLVLTDATGRKFVACGTYSVSGYDFDQSYPFHYYSNGYYFYDQYGTYRSWYHNRSGYGSGIGQQ